MEKPLRKEIRLQWVHCNFPHYYTIFDLQLVRSFVHCSNSFCCWTAPPHPLCVQHAAVHLPRVQCISHYYFVLFLIHLARRYTTNWEIDQLHFWWNFLQSPLRSIFLALLTLHQPLFADCFFNVKKLIEFANQVALELGALELELELECWESLPCADIDILRPPAASHRHATRPAARRVHGESDTS